MNQAVAAGVDLNQIGGALVSWRRPIEDFEPLLHGQIDAFAIVRVLDTELFASEGERALAAGDQLSTVEVLDMIYGELSGGTIEVQQHFYLYPRFISELRELGFVHGGSKGSLLRQGGVYILPLERFHPSRFADLGHLPQREMYMTVSAFGALFEIDDMGHLHSVFPALNRFDGEQFLVLREEIERLTGDPLEMLSRTPFGRVVERHDLIE
ncbi:MAG: hypothetical protein FWD84_05550, partial [Oscillospiraceae bacterium]|nr:hypothetical protein [Oscillospiraceae bacterium]